MASDFVRELLNVGIHFGHHTSRWNPKMKPYIYGSRNRVHIIDIRETLKGLLRGRKFISSVVASGRDVLFVGTKRQAREAIETAAGSCEMPYVTERWLGGTLTNFRTIRARLKRLDELETIMGTDEWSGSRYSKKMKSMMTREWRKIRRNLQGIRTMERLPGALILVDARKETNALREARSLKIPTVCLIDTDSDPDTTSIAIPGNDDAMRGIDMIVAKLAEAVVEGKRGRVSPADKDGKSGATSRERRPAPVTPVDAPAPQAAEAAAPDVSADATPTPEATATTTDAPVAAPAQPDTETSNA